MSKAVYHFFKIGAKLALKIYCSKTVVHFDEATSYTAPKIIASNHPNSFYDAIVIAVNYPKPIYFLARGDAFKKPIVAKFLNALQLIPIYRLSEGKSNLIKNDDTFKTCISLFKQNETILIFSEGLCINEWKLRPLRKGTARLALLALNAGIDNLQIQPTNLNYSSFLTNPKKILINFNQEFNASVFTLEQDSFFYNCFNTKLKEGISDHLQIAEREEDMTALFYEKKSHAQKVALAAPAFLGYLLNACIYYYFKKKAQKKTKNTVFYDSVLFGLLLIFYPVIVLTIAVVMGFIAGYVTAIITFLIFPLTAYCYSQYKR